MFFGRKYFLLFSFLLGILLWGSACAENPCYRYFNQLKTRCRLASTTEGAKLEQFLEKPFHACQVEMCESVSPNEIDCFDPDTHIPGGINGRFMTCEKSPSQ